MINIEIENLRSDFNKNENTKLYKLTQEKDYYKILESLVDENIKISKLLSCQFGWIIGFSAYKGNKFTI